MLFVFVIALVGCLSALRIAHSLESRHLFARSELTKIGTITFACALALAVMSPRTFIVAWMIVFVSIACAAFSLSVRVSRRSRAFRSECATLLTLVLLKMKSGRAFRSSFDEAIDESGARVRAKFSEIGAVVAFSQQRSGTRIDPFVREFVEELAVIDRHPHLAVRRLETYREKIETEEEFRRRSGQVLARIRAQSLVMTGLFLAVCAFMIAKFGWQRNAALFALATTSFGLGAIWLWFGGRKKRWKV